MQLPLETSWAYPSTRTSTERNSRIVLLHIHVFGIHPAVSVCLFLVQPEYLVLDPIGRTSLPVWIRYQKRYVRIDFSVFPVPCLRDYVSVWPGVVRMRGYQSLYGDACLPDPTIPALNLVYPESNKSNMDLLYNPAPENLFI